MEPLKKDLPSRRWFGLGVILLVGLGLRVWGLQWGLPAKGPFFHGSSYHPDEIELFEGLRELSWHRKQFYPTNLAMLSRGTLQIYLVGGAVGIAYPWLVISRDREVYKKDPGALARLYLVGRAVSVAQSLAAIAALFWLGTLLANWRVGTGAAVLMAVAPIQVVNAHYISTDSAFCLYLILLVIASYYIFKTATWQSYLTAGLLWGLLTANKYNAASTGLIVFIAHFLSDSPKKSVRSLAALVAVAGVVFFVSTPAVVFGFHDLRQALLHSYRINIGRRFLMYDGGYPANAVRFYCWDAGLYGLGLPLLLVCFAGVVYTATHFSRVHWLWVPWAVVFLLMLFQTGWRLVRWIMPLTPFLFLEAARLWDDAALWRRWKPVRSVLTALALGYTTLYSCAYVQAMTTPDTRDLSSDWIAQHIPRGARIAMSDTPYFWTPTIFQSPYYHPDEAQALRQERGYEMSYLLPSLEELWKADPTHVILTTYDIDVYLRNPTYYQTLPEGRYIAELLNPQKYKVLAVFDKQLPPAGRAWFGNSFNYPHDWKYPFPRILILGKSP